MIRIFKKIFSFKKNKNIYLIDSNDQIDFAVDILSSEKILGLDTEFDWRNTYHPILSLLQIESSKDILLIDCIKCTRLKFLKPILENSSVLKVFHSSRSDTTVLSTNLNIKIKNVFDIQIAEKIIHGGEIKNYASIVGNYFFISLDKAETNSNWLKRPFTENQLIYAADDVAFLIEIYKKQLQILRKNCLVEKAFIDSKREAKLGNEKLSKIRLKKITKFSQKHKEIFIWREDLALINNIPPSHILKDREIKNLAKDIGTNNFNNENLLKIIKNNNYADHFMEKFLG